MQEVVVGKSKSRRTRQQVLDLVRLFDHAALSVRDFCRQYAIHEGTFHRWRRKYGSSQQPAGHAGFSELQVVACTSGEVLFAQVGTIKIYHPVEAAYLKELAR